MTRKNIVNVLALLFIPFVLLFTINDEYTGSARRRRERHDQQIYLQPIRRTPRTRNLRRFLGGEKSPIPNTRGIRNDVVTALKKSKSLRCDGPADALPMNIIGKTGSVHAPVGPRWSIPIGEESPRITVSERTSSWTCVNSRMRARYFWQHR